MTETGIIKKVIVTERSVAMNEHRKYVFLVQPHATKNEVKKAVKELYHVDVANVNMITLPGKTKRFRNVKTKQSSIKKAVVTLKEGQKVDVT